MLGVQVRFQVRGLAEPLGVLCVASLALVIRTAPGPGGSLKVPELIRRLKPAALNVLLAWLTWTLMVTGWPTTGVERKVTVALVPPLAPVTWQPVQA